MEGEPEPRAKAAKLHDLNRFRRKLPHVSQSALSAMLQEAKTNGIPELTSRQDIAAARDELAKCTKTPFGPIHQTVDANTRAGGVKKLALAHPIALLWYLLFTSCSFARYVERLHDEKPSSPDEPWNFILYSDEVTPGNQLKVDNKRKLQVVYGSLMEFTDALSSEDMWLTIVGKRSSEVKLLDGGMAQVFRIILHMLFVTNTIATTGAVFKLASGRQLRIYMKLKMVLQDGGAHKMVWHTRGDSGAKFCVFCRNAIDWSKTIADEGDDEDELCGCMCITYAELDLATSAEIKEGARLVERHRLTDTPERFRVRQMGAGFTYDGYSLLCDAELDPFLDPAAQICHDWMHCLFVAGVWNLVFNSTLRFFRMNGVPDIYDRLRAYVAQWHMPRRLKQSKLSELFSNNRQGPNDKSKRFKCDASAAYSLYGVVFAFFMSIVGIAATQIPLELQVYRALVDLIDMFQTISRLVPVDPAVLLQQVEAFLALYTNAYGIETMTPKFHWLLHFADMYAEHKMLVACYVHERKHKMLKSYCNDIKNTVAFEMSVLTEVILPPHAYGLAIGINRTPFLVWTD